MRRTSLFVVLALLLAGGPQPARAARATEKPTAVVALIDTGINPYHVVFRDDSPLGQKHPSTYIPGFPKDAKALRLSLKEDSYEEAVKKDCKVWASVKPRRLYWFPGTKIIGGITFQTTTLAVNAPGNVCPRSTPRAGAILDTFGHGTMVASRAAATGYGACPDCRIVAVQGNTPGVKWAAKNSHWIDAQSNSWGPVIPAWAPSGPDLVYNTPAFVRTVEAAARKHLSFWATGNGAATRFGVLGHPTIIDPRMTPSIVMAGGHDSGYINLWPDFPPHVVADSCDSWAAFHNQIDKSAENVGGGTSAATPWAAGGAAQMLLEARRLFGDTDTGVEKGVAASGEKGAVAKGPLADGRFTLAEWKEVLFKTATPRPKGQKEDGPMCGPIEGLVLYSSTPVRWEQVPDGYPEFLHIGYGAVDNVSLDLAADVLSGKEEIPDRSMADSYFEADGIVRSSLHDIFRG